MSPPSRYVEANVGGTLKGPPGVGSRPATMASVSACHCLASFMVQVLRKASSRPTGGCDEGTETKMPAPPSVKLEGAGGGFMTRLPPTVDRSTVERRPGWPPPSASARQNRPSPLGG